MDALDEARLAEAERAISTAMVTEFGLDLSRHRHDSAT